MSSATKPWSSSALITENALAQTTTTASRVAWAVAVLRSTDTAVSIRGVKPFTPGICETDIMLRCPATT